MRSVRGGIATAVVVAAALLVAAPAASARTQTAHAGNVKATFTFSGGRAQRLAIARGGKVVYDQPVTSRFCTPCSAGIGLRSAVHAADLEHTGQPDVVLDLYTGGAHCCTVEQFFSFDRATGTYVKTERDFGDPLVRIVNLRHNHRFQLSTRDDSFAYEFTAFAFSGLPIQIFTFSHGHFKNVTRRFPKLIARDAALWLREFNRTAPSYQGSTGLIAAWAADEDLLGHSKAVARYLSQQAAAGHLKSGTGGALPSGKRFVAKLQRFLRHHGYLR
jgi:hypothetical protein